MTKKHYEMVAAALRAEIEANPGPGGIAESARTATRRIAATLADAFAIDNARFDPVLFLAAVEPPAAPSPFEEMPTLLVDNRDPAARPIVTELPRMGENRLGADSVMEWDDLSDFDAHLDDVGE